MPYAFAPRDVSQLGQVSRWDVPLNQWLGLKFAQGAHDTFFGAGMRYVEDQISDGPEVMQPELANKVFGVPGYLDFKEPISIQRARFMRERKDDELRRLTYLTSATHSPVGAKAALGTLAGMGGAVANPLDFSLMFIPFVGSAAKAAGVAKMGGGRLQQLFARGFLTTEEALATSTRFPAFGAAVVNGTLGNAITEIPVFLQNVRDQAIYGPGDAAVNVFLGGATGGAFHVAGAALGRLLKLAGDTHGNLSPDVQETALRQAINDVLDGKAISSDKLAVTDRGAILRDLQFDEARARAEALERVGAPPEEAAARAILESVNKKQTSAVDLLDLARAKANTGGVQGKIAARLVQRFFDGDRSVGLMDQIADLFDLRYNPLAPTLQENFKRGLLFGPYDQLRGSAAASFKRARGQLHELDRVLVGLNDQIRTAAPGSLIERQLRSNLGALQAERNQILIDMENARGAIQQPKALTPEELSAHADEKLQRGVTFDDSELEARAAQLEARADEVRETRMAEYIEKERARYQAGVSNTADGLYREQLRAEVEKGKILTDEQVKELTKDPTDEGGAAIVKENIANLERELKALPADSPLAEIIQRELAAIDKDTPDLSKAVDAAAECLAGTIT